MANQTNTEVLTAFNRIPYSLINEEVVGSTKDTLAELTEICGYYKIYHQGAKFETEGTNGDYIPAELKYKLSASLIDKEARFMFAESPDISIEPKGDLGQTTQDTKDQITVLNDMVKTILEENMFESQLIKAAKDCFIGKRVAGLINFNEEDGVTVSFIPSTQFLYDTKMGNPNVITKFVCFIIVQDSLTLSEKRIFKKKYELIDGVVYLSEKLYDGTGVVLEDITENQPTLMPIIPAVVFINECLTGEELGESEIRLLKDHESWYSKLSDADKDAERKSMNPIRYTVDMDNNSTKGLVTSPGAFWDLGSDQNLDNANVMIGALESNMNYSSALKTTLDRIKASAYDLVDMPDITLDTMQGAITSGKALKAVYWKLIVRCKEKMKMWAPQLRKMVQIIIEGALVYPMCVEKYISDNIYPIDYKVSIEQNIPLPEDEIEEKTMDLAEVESNVMSRRTYMKKWRGLTDDEVQEELEQIALERQIVEDSSFSTTSSNVEVEEEAIEDDAEPYPNVAEEIGMTEG